MNKKTIYALGFFDGVHLGHQALLAACRSLAQENGCRAGAVTFSHHPETLVVGKAPLLIGTIEDRKTLLEGYGMEVVTVLTFDKALRETPWQDFLGGFPDAGGFVCGSDFRFGKMGAGDAAALENYCNAHGLVCAVVPQQLLEGIRVSSTHIRSLLEMGDMTQAVKFLGHPYRLTGTVVAGKQLGRTMGIPTANLTFPAGLVMPKAGVYACTCVADGVSHPAVTNIGTRPTVSGEGVTVESWLLDFDGDLYGKEITLSFHAFLREEKKFASLEELQAQIRADAETARLFL